MRQVSLTEATRELSNLIEAAVEGETVYIVADDQQVIQLVPVPAEKNVRNLEALRALSFGLLMISMRL
jgi:antitoxin (DNA-binding transcriptional repressor) of toxin-antitoxin stability system